MSDNNTNIDVLSLYPLEWERRTQVNDGAEILIRPIIPEDEALYTSFMKKNDFDDIRHRFFGSIKELSPDLLTQLTQIDYDNVMAFVALDSQNSDLLGVSRYVRDKEGEQAEYTVMTRSDLKENGIGFSLSSILIEYAKSKNIHSLWVEIMRDNYEMIEMCKDLHFNITADEDTSSCVVARLSLN